MNLEEPAIYQLYIPGAENIELNAASALLRGIKLDEFVKSTIPALSASGSGSVSGSKRLAGQLPIPTPTATPTPRDMLVLTFYDRIKLDEFVKTHK
jgi:hypothetical protein